MCRILFARAAVPFSIADQLTPFAQIAKNSREYQGHGWGCSWLVSEDGADAVAWQHYHNIKPVWDDDLHQFPDTRLLLVHARSAFRDEGIVVENNMPFTDGETVFIFNGELRGVKIKSEGRIGAEKIYNYVRRMDKGDKYRALEKAVSIINRRTSYVRAMNIIMSDGITSVVSSTYGEDPEYFQMYRTNRDGLELICSEPFPDDRPGEHSNEQEWQPMGNHFTLTA